MAQRESLLRDLGDYCLLFAGFFPALALRRRVTDDYFSELGKSVYGEIAVYHSGANQVLYRELALQFDFMKDVLRSIQSFSSSNTRNGNVAR